MPNYYNINSGKNFITVDEILSMYLWNSKTPPSGSALKDDKWIRDQEKPLVDPLKINAQEYMDYGGGRFVSPADFLIVSDFFNSKKSIKAGTYGFKEIYNDILHREALNNGTKDKLPEDLNELQFKVKQYTSGIGSSDFITRAFVFGSTSFTLDWDTLAFVVNSDGSREVHNIKIKPVKDNFDFESADPVAQYFNEGFKKDIDPSKIGRKVPIEFQGDVVSVNVTKEEFDALVDKKKEIDNSVFDYGKLYYYLKEINRLIANSPAIEHTDEKGRKVYYDGIDDDNNGVVSRFELAEDVALIGGKGDDSLVSGHGDDYLDGGKGYDSMAGGLGYDEYHADKHDTIFDSDGKGEVFLDKTKLSGGENDPKTDSANIYYGNGLTYYWAGDDLSVEGLLIKNFNNGDLGIRLRKKEKEPDTGTAESQISPIVIDLNGDGVQTTAKGGHIYHDHDGNGFAENTGWASAEDALLVRDLNNNNQIDNGGELFGNNTLLPDGTKAANGFEALKAYDANGDKQITEQDAIWQELKLWQDKNQNGYVDTGELTTIQNSGITAILLNYQNSSFV
ncbi:hypothetical protein [Stenoxybacter acetivorans]|uniref:hypothetical protein n=1 Tax=Stenoxybacter acetivorans TaxID=422441 RepID=UPI00068C9041|nr:hypothetical protein [Stenoxybacter acetivorans]